MPTINAAQLRAARALLRMSPERLAVLSGVDAATIGGFEEETLAPPRPVRDRLQAALEANGAMFLPDSTRGVGVRFKFNRRETRAISRWEGEGGSVADDDVQ